MNKYTDKYALLSPEQKQFVDEKMVSATMRIGKWISLLGKISKFDQRNDAFVKKLLIWAIVSFVLALVSIFLTGAFQENAFFIVLAFAIIGILLLVWRNKLRARDVNNYLRLFFLPVLKVLEAKCGSDAKLAASLDFRMPRKVLEPVKSKVGVRNLKLYSPKYIVARVTMKDQSVLEFVVGDDIKDFSWKKTSSSGKTKFKKKTKNVHQCLIKLTLSKNEYEYKGSSDPDVSVIDHNGHYQAKTKIKIKTIGKDKVLDVKAFLEAMQKIFDQFNPKNPWAKTSQDRKESDRTDKEVHEEDEYVDYAAPYIWFGMYDYDSFEYGEYGEDIVEDDSVTAFDS